MVTKVKGGWTFVDGGDARARVLAWFVEKERERFEGYAAMTDLEVRRVLEIYHTKTNKTFTAEDIRAGRHRAPRRW